MRELQIILERDGVVHRELRIRGGQTPPIGMTYLIHLDDEEPSMWVVVSVHRELFPGTEPTIALTDRPMTVVSPDDYHEGGVTVVVVRPRKGVSSGG